MIDSHCHLAGPEFADDLPDVIARARAAGLVRCLVILDSEDEAELEQAVRVHELWPEAQFAIGVHPHHAGHFADDPVRSAALTASRVEQVAAAGLQVVAIGEVGLDYHYDFAPRDVQHAVFRAHVRLALERSLPVVIHTRNADEDTLRLIGEEGQNALRGVFHCFTGDRPAAERALATGFLLSIPGIVTFPKAGELREAVVSIPDDRLLIETDSPFLAPIPHRGKRNEPVFVRGVFDQLVSIRSADPARLGAQLLGNFDRLFGANAGAT